MHVKLQSQQYQLFMIFNPPGLVFVKSIKKQINKPVLFYSIYIEY